MGRQYSVYLSATTLTANSTKTMILLNPASAPITLVEFGISLDNVTTNAEPILVEAYRTTAVGSPAGAAASLVALDEAWESSLNNALTALTVEPTTVNVVGGWYVQPNSGLFVIQWPLGRELVRAKAAGNRIGLRYTTVAGVTPKAVAYSIHEE